MFDNNKKQEVFDQWLIEGLKKNPVPASDAFTKSVLSEEELLRSQEILRKITLQEKIAGWVFCCAVAAGLGMLLCPPILRATYSALEEILRTLIYTAIQPGRLNLGMVALVLLALGLLTKSLWDNLTSEM